MASRLQDVILRDTRALQPGAATVAPGTLYFVTNENVIERSNGTIWQSYSGSGSSSSSSFGQAIILGEDGQDGLDGLPGISGTPGPAGSGSSGIVLVRLPITELELEALNTVPFIMVAAQGANKIVIPILFSLEMIVGTGYSSTPTISVFHTGSALNLITTTLTPTWNIIGTNLRIAPYGTPGYVAYSTFDPRNKSLELKASANPTGTGVATAVVNLLYMVATTV